MLKILTFIILSISINCFSQLLEGVYKGYFYDNQDKKLDAFLFLNQLPQRQGSYIGIVMGEYKKLIIDPTEDFNEYRNYQLLQHYNLIEKPKQEDAYLEIFLVDQYENSFGLKKLNQKTFEFESIPSLEMNIIKNKKLLLNISGINYQMKFSKKNNKKKLSPIKTKKYIHYGSISKFNVIQKNNQLLAIFNSSKYQGQYSFKEVFPSIYAAFKIALNSVEVIEQQQPDFMLVSFFEDGMDKIYLLSGSTAFVYE